MSEEVPAALIVGGGFAGVTCAQELGDNHTSAHLIDRLDYHQFQPMLYQLATAQVAATEVAFPLRAIFRDYTDLVHVTTAEVASVDVERSAVTTVDGVELRGEVLVLAAGGTANFFDTPGAAEHSFPLYSVDQANSLRSRLLGVLDDVDAKPSRVEQGGITFVVVGGGATGVETAGALADLFRDVAGKAYPGIPMDKLRIVLVDHGDVVLNGFSDKAHHYARAQLEERGVELMLGKGVKAVDADGVTLDDGTTILSKTVIWGAGEKASPIITASGLPTGRGGRIDVDPDLRVPGHPNVYCLGDAANITIDGAVLPQLGSVAQQSGRWAARNILRVRDGHDTEPFSYRDKGIMAMIGRNAAVAEMGKKRHEVDGHVAFAAWLGVHADLLSSNHQRVSSFIDWGWDYFTSRRVEYLADRPESYVIDWGE